MDQEEVLSGLLGSLGNLNKGMQSSQIISISVNLTVIGINKGMKPKEVVEYFYDVMNEMKKHGSKK